MTAWHEVHAGDVVLSPDGREYLVTDRASLPPPRGTVFVLIPADAPDFKVAICPPLDLSVTVVRRGDLSPERLAAQALINGGFTVELLAEQLDIERRDHA